MARPALHDLRNAADAADVLASLKRLKNDVVGHDQRKEEAIRDGVVRVLVDILEGETSGGGIQLGGSVHPEGGVHLGGGIRLGGFEERTGWSTENEVRVQAVQVVASLAHGGLSFVRPIVAGGVLPALLSAFSPRTVPPRLLLETLRALSVIAEALVTDAQPAEQRPLLASLTGLLYSRQTVECFAEILGQRSSSKVIEEQMVLTMGIFSLTLTHSNTLAQCQDALLKGRVLDLLASRLAAIVSSRGHTFNPLEEEQMEDLMPLHPNSFLPHLLEAIAAIVQCSMYKTLRLLYSPDLNQVFPVITTTQPSTTTFAEGPPIPNNAIDLLLPKLQAVQSKTEHSFSKAFPALGSFAQESTRMPHLDSAVQPSVRTISSEEFGSSLIGWLIHVARTSGALDRLATLWLLTHLVHATDQNVQDFWAEPSRNRDRTLALLVVPLLVRMIEDAGSTKTITDRDANRRIKERAPLALATLIQDSPALQKAAVDAKAIDLLTSMLKKSFDPYPLTAPRLWSPAPRGDAAGAREDEILGPVGLSDQALHMLNSRAAALRALAAIAQKDDAHRKIVLERGVMACVVDSLMPYEEDPVKGNPNFVIVAALKLATALSRSVSILRTSLFDGGITEPVFKLMKHPSFEVQLAATDVVTNLALQFSPMREQLISFGILDILCEHARSASAEMCFSSLWALKHLICTAPNDFKIPVFTKLGPHWLLNAMRGAVPPPPPRSRMATPNAQGQQVDLLNMDDAMDDAPLSPEGDIGNAPLAPDVAKWLRHIRDEELNPVRRAQRDDVRIQWQALEVVRNLITEPGKPQHEMIDHVLQEMGAEALFAVLLSKLRPRNGATAQGKRPAPSAGRASGVGGAFPEDDASREVLTSAMFVVIHIANGLPKHRHLLLEQEALLACIPPLFKHPDRNVRAACCWLVHNVLWMEDAADAGPVRERAHVLRGMGFERDVRDAAAKDVDLDVRERAKGCVEVFGR
ncbi:ARM repeat-containing protein, partial [Trichodelitschia bisporula]